MNCDVQFCTCVRVNIFFSFLKEIVTETINVVLKRISGDEVWKKVGGGNLQWRKKEQSDHI